MELTNEFTVPVPVERAWEVLTDVELIAPCLPGAQLQEIEGDEYRGVVKVKVGPITAQYKGAATFQEQDEANRRLVLKAEGRDTRGQGSASAVITVAMQETGGSTHVSVDTDLTIKGKVAQFGRGMIADVSAKLLTQFVECLEGKLEAPVPGPPRRWPSRPRRRRRRPPWPAPSSRASPPRRPPPARPPARPPRARPPRPPAPRRRACAPSPSPSPRPSTWSAPPAARSRSGSSPSSSWSWCCGCSAGAGPTRAPEPVPAVADEADVAAVAELLGRAPQAEFDVVVRDAAGRPVVIRNAPLLFDGTPMPTRYWLVGEEERARVGRLESTGAIDRAEREIGEDVIAEAHARYAAERDAALPPDHEGPRPSGGVGGTRRGIKCFHAHWAWHLAGGDDPVGRWIERELAALEG